MKKQVWKCVKVKDPEKKETENDGSVTFISLIRINLERPWKDALSMGTHKLIGSIC